MKIFIILVLASSLALGQSRAVQTWNADNIVWQRTDSDGTKWAVLEGDKDAPGKAFTYAFFLPAGHWEHHFHNQPKRTGCNPVSPSGTRRFKSSPVHQSASVRELE